MAPLPQPDPGDQWDAIVVGGGLGGGTLGYALARAGWRVLFCERGQSSLAGAAAIRGRYPEDVAGASERERRDHLRAGGRLDVSIDDRSRGVSRPSIPFIGSGTGGSSALYGMVLERLRPADFTPRQHYRDAADSSLPESWPITYAELAPYYAQAEALYGVRGARTESGASPPGDGPPLSPAPLMPVNQEFVAHFKAKGLSTYALPLAARLGEECEGCQGYLCDRDCKGDSGRICLQPAVRDHAATLLDECEVVQLTADRRRVTGVVCNHRGTERRLRARVVVLAAGALATPALLLRSASPDWPAGLANPNDLVGRNLMRHYVDLYPVFPRQKVPAQGNLKQLGCDDLYQTESGKFGVIQSFGRMPTAAAMAEEMRSDLQLALPALLARGLGVGLPVLCKGLAAMLSRTVVFASLMEDLPYPDNRVFLAPSSTGEAVRAFEYRIRPSEAARIAAFRKRVQSALAPYRFLKVLEAESNRRFAHACGTCRFGTDASDSVLDRYNRAHGLENLFVVDGSFFPSSGGVNPALTIAANALRVGHHLIEQGKPG